MKFKLGLFCWLICASSGAMASPGASKESLRDPQQKLSTSLNFDDLLIEGKYQFSDEAVVTVEEDKVLDSLLGVRKDFNDRIEKSLEQY